MTKKNKLTYFDCTIPDFALPYLVNGDSSGLDDSEIIAIDKWYDDNFTPFVGWFDIPDDFDAHFCWLHDLSRYGILACNCVDIKFIVGGK